MHFQAPKHWQRIDKIYKLFFLLPFPKALQKVEHGPGKGPRVEDMRPYVKHNQAHTKL